MTTNTYTPIDGLAGWVDVLRAATAEKARAEAVIEQARGKIEEALGDMEVGTVAGIPVVKWTHVTTNRFDQKKAKEFLGDAAESFMVPSTSRRFTLVDPA